MKRIVSIQDLSCLGKCSLTVALPVISAMGVECAVVPTAVLSTHTMFEGFTCRDLTGEIAPIAAHWQKEKVRFDAIYTGYLASAEQTEVVCSFLDQFRTADNFVLVDPAMADHGRLYAAFDESFPPHMAKVCAKADLVVPNLTEAALLTGLPYREEYDPVYLRELLAALTDMGPRYAAVTGVSPSPGQLGAAMWDREAGRYFETFAERVPTSYHGTGDLFASVCAGALMNELPLEAALTLAVRYVAATIEETAKTPGSSWYGVEFERTIPQLLDLLSAAKSS